MRETEVLIVGAGPSGLVLALWLKAFGVDVRLVDAASGPGTTSRALAVQARTLELYRQLDLAQPVLEDGHPIQFFNIWSEGEHRARIPLGAIGADLTPYPFLHIYPQDRHERLLADRLAAGGLEVERKVTLTGYAERGDHVEARLAHANGDEETCAARWLIGCDGARSSVRNAMGVGFPGGTYRQVFYVADIEGDSPALNGELNLDLDESDILAVFATAPRGKARLVGTVRDERAERAETLQFSDVSGRAIDNLMISVHMVNWFSTYRVHHRVADQFRRGRAFLVGDAGHIHSPAGGQGMNTGIGDAINLAWKLAAVVQGGAAESLLDSYEAERLPFARRLVDTTDRAFSFITADGPLAEIVRTGIVPRIMPLVGKLPAAREYFFRTISQTVLHYRHGPLNAGRAGKVHGGDRLPWVRFETGDNFAPVKPNGGPGLGVRTDFGTRPGWQAHVYGSARPELIAWCALHGVPLRQFEWSLDCANAGLAEDAFYLLRPDSYVGLAAAVGAGPAATEVLDDYLRTNSLRL
ncbi:FAD-dependent monooxygenase [Massilia sp. Leaf139]|uniref:FAD-dependent monooxygenase n=1 Tax=Massilia sp. Leaf139 TaxID=1736272 RepID=UPI0006FE6C61|nr:FAD-dependent monooxygenase [Massilia sp. Leaf139]KQQ97511.1 FAD-dependent oxidoreductase [Massilia sp. Leaf139]